MKIKGTVVSGSDVETKMAITIPAFACSSKPYLVNVKIKKRQLFV